jgi:hypothetical protein
MQFTPLKMAVAAAWLLVVFAVAFLTSVGTITGWITTIGLGILPFVFLRRAWPRPTQTLSESIQAELGR